MKKIITFLFLLFSFNIQAKLKIVTTTENINSIVHEIGGNKIDLHFITKDVTSDATLERVDLLISNGLTLEDPWLKNLIESSNNPNIKTGRSGYLSLGDFIKPLKLEVMTINEGQVPVASNLINPHFMLDPQNIIDLADKISVRLGELDPDNKNLYQNQADILKDRISARMVSWIKRLNKNPNKKIITTNHSLDYFLQRFGFNNIASLEDFTSPNADFSESIIRLAEKENVRIILIQSLQDLMFEKKLTQKGISVKKVRISINENSNIKTYFDLMEFLVKTLEK